MNGTPVFPRPARSRPWACLRLGCAAFAIVVCPGVTAGPVSFFLELEGVEGPSEVPGREGAIEVESWNWGASQSATTHFGGSPGTGKVFVQDLSVSKAADVTSPQLLGHLVTGDSIPTGRLEIFEDFSGKSIRVLAIDLEDILVTSQSLGGSSGLPPVEFLSLNFARFNFVQIPVEFGVAEDPLGITWDIPGNAGGALTLTPPTISPVADQTIPEDGAVTVPFTVSDAETADGALILLRSSSNPAVVPVSGMTLGGEGTDRTLRIEPAPDQSGSAVVELLVDDGYETASTTFTVTVNPVNDPPTIGPIPTQVMAAGSTLAVDVEVDDIDSDLATVTLAPTDSSNSSILPLSGITFSGTGPVRTMSLTPLPGQAGLVTVTIGATDGTDTSAPQSFLLSINSAAGGTPTDITLSSNLVPENSAGGTEVGVLSTIDPDSGDSASYALLDDAGGRFGIGGTASDRLVVADGTLLDFEANGSHSVVVQTTDGSGNSFSKALLVQVQNVNEPPAMQLPTQIQVPPNTPKPLTGVSFSDPDGATIDIGVLFTVGAGVLHFNDSPPFAGTVGGNGTAALSIQGPIDMLNGMLAGNGLTYHNTDLSVLSDTLAIQLSDLGNTGTGDPIEVLDEVPIVISLTRFETWLRLYYSPAELADPTLVGTNADGDGDSIITLFEYLLGLDPTLLEPGPHVEVIEVEAEVEGVTERYPALRFKRLLPFYDPSVGLSVDVATDLSNWAPDAVYAGSDPAAYPYEIVVIRSLYSYTERPVQQFRLRSIVNPTF